MAEQTDVRLIIQARDEASKHLEELLETTREFLEANKELGKGSTEVSGKFKELDNTFRKIERSITDLAKVRKLATDYEKAADKTEKLRRATSTLAADIRTLRQQQAQAAAASSKQATALEEARKKVQAKQSASSRLRKTLAELRSAEKQNADAIAETSAKLEKVKKEEVELKRTRDQLKTETQLANAQQKSYAAEARRLEAQLRKNRRTFVELVHAKKTAGAAARQAGVDTRNLANEQARLDKELDQTRTSARQATQSIKGLGTATRTTAARTKQAATGWEIFTDNSRKSMSVFQRVRGQILSIAAAYIGLYGAVEQVRQSYRTFFAMQSAQSRLATQFEGDMNAVGEEMEFVRKQAYRLGLELESTEKAYSKFFVVSREAGNEADATRGLWLDLAEAGVAMRVSTDDMEGAMRAVEQIMSKGQVMAEELRGQLGERFPAAVSIMARALNLSTEQLNKLMEQGQLTSRTLFAFARQAREQFGKGLPTALNSMQAATNRLLNRWTDLQRVFAEESEGDLKDSINDLADALGSPEVLEAVRSLSRGFASMIRWLVSMKDYVDEIGLALKIAFFTFGAQAILSAIGAIGSFLTMLVATNGKLTKTARLMRTIMLLPLLFEGGRYVFDNFGTDLKYFFMEQIPHMAKTSAQILWVYFKRFGVQLELMFVDLFENTIGAAGTLVGGPLGKALAQRFGNEMAGRRRTELLSEQINLNEELWEIEKSRLQGLIDIEDRKQRELKTDKEKAKSEMDAAEARAAAMEDEARAAAQREADKVRRELEEAERRQRMQAEIRKQMEFEQKVYKQLAKLRRDLQGEGPFTADELRSRFREDVKDLILDLRELNDTVGLDLVNSWIEVQTQQALADQQAKQYADREGELNKLVAHRRDLMAYIKTLDKTDDAGMISQLKDQLTGVNAEIEKAVDGMIALAKAAGDEVALARFQLLKTQITSVKEEVLLTGEMISNQLADNAVQAFDSMSKALGDYLTGAGSMKDVFAAAGNAFRQFAADTLMWLAKLIMRQIIFNMLQSAFGGAFTGFAGGVNAAVQHSGGVTGSTGRSRSVPAGVFSAAPKYHAGGVAGLAPNEVPAILQKGEEVLTRNDPRHRLNGGMMGGAAQQAQTERPIKVINAIDSASVVTEGLNSSSGERVFMNVIRANRSQIKRILG